MSSRWLWFFIIIACGFNDHSSASEVPESIFLKCSPPIDYTDGDPVIEAWIYAKFNLANNYEANVLTVVHRTRNDNRYARMYQYDAIIESDPRLYKWTWTGSLKRDPQYRMTGSLAYGDNWSYHETVMINGRFVSTTQFTCPAQ